MDSFSVADYFLDLPHNFYAIFVYKNHEVSVLARQITNGKRSIVKMLPGSVLLCPGPVPVLLGWAYPE